jgi:hypothetical protein
VLEPFVTQIQEKTSALKFSSVDASVLNHFSWERRLVSRQIYKQKPDATLAAWRAVMD